MSVLDRAFDGDALEHALRPRRPAVESSRTGASHGAATVGHVAVVTVTIAAVLAASSFSTTTIPSVIVAAAIWVAAFRSVYANGWLSPLAIGYPFASALGAAMGLAGASAAAKLIPGLDALTPFALLSAAAALAVTSCAYAAIARPRIERRRRLLVVGLEDGGVDVVLELNAHPELPFDCIGIVDDADSAAAGGILGGTADLAAVVERERPDLVVLAGVRDRARAIDELFDASTRPFQLVDVHHFYEHALGRVPLQHLSPAWFMCILHLYRRPYSRLSKRAFDLTVSVIALVLVAPILPLVAALVRLSGPGPVLFKQVRLGEAGRPFRICKFRTMVADAEQDGVAVWASERDPRITPVGRFLRRTRLDELPQLWNVLRGDMSIVGPRPERPEFLNQLADEVPFWIRRHLVKPGITGWAQLRCGYTSDAVGAAEKLSYDLYYLKHRSLLLDVAIAARTAAVVVTGSGAH